MPLHHRRRSPATTSQQLAAASSSSDNNIEPDRIHRPQHIHDDGDEQPQDGDSETNEEEKRDFRPPTNVASTPIETQRRRQRREIAPRSTDVAATLPRSRRRLDDDARQYNQQQQPYDWQQQPHQGQEFMYYSSPSATTSFQPPTPQQHRRATQSQSAPSSSSSRSIMRSRIIAPREFHPDVSFGTDIEYLPPANDEIGPDVAETFNLGSFGEDSPPRGSSTPHRRSSPRPSPPRLHHPSRPPYPGYSPYAPGAGGAHPSQPPPPPHHHQPQSRPSPYGATPTATGSTSAAASSYPTYYPPPSHGTPSASYGPPPDRRAMHGAMPPHYASYPYYYYPPPPQHYPTPHHNHGHHPQVSTMQQHPLPPPHGQAAPWSSPEAYHGAPTHMVGGGGDGPLPPTRTATTPRNDDDIDMDRKYSATTPAAESSPPRKKKQRRESSQHQTTTTSSTSSPTPPAPLADSTPDETPQQQHHLEEESSGDDDRLTMEEDDQGRLIIRSPFRSPPPSATSKYKKLFQASPPGIGSLGSFGLMGTPGGLTELSPMLERGGRNESEHTPFGTNNSLGDDHMSIIIGEGDFATRLPLDRSEDDDEDVQQQPQRGEGEGEEAPEPEQQKEQHREGLEGYEHAEKSQRRRLLSSGGGTSGGTGSNSTSKSFVRDFSPLGGGMQVSRSPLRSERRSRESTSSTFETSGILSPPRPESRSSLPIRTSTGISTRLLASPLGHPRSSAKPRKLWHETVAPTPGPVRLELGDVGGPSERQRTLEGINIMMRASTKHPPPKQNIPSDRRSPYPSSSRTPAHASERVPQQPISYRDSISTPSHRAPTHGAPATSSSSRPGNHPMQGSFPQPPPSSVAKPPPGLAYASLVPRSTPSVGMTTPGSIKPTPSSGKENTGNATPSTASKRKPCNCKKSRCLKLYCECFAAEVYCEGCNCSECHNLAAFEPNRSKAIKDIRGKNPHAFKPRITVKPSPVEGPSPQSGHNMGCRCKRSECLKKYCECFQAGVICGNKCKCVECLNYAGSQALIDKRRKIKDHRGADFAMRVADEAWKGKSVSMRNPSLPAVRGVGAPIPSPAAIAMGQFPPPPLPPVMMQQRPSPTGPHAQAPPHHYMQQHVMMGAAMAYPHMGMPAVTPGYPGTMPPQLLSQHSAQQQEPHRRGSSSAAPRHPGPRASRHPSDVSTTASTLSVARSTQVTPVMAATPRPPAIRIDFDPSERRARLTLPEPTLDFFGSHVPEQPKTTALAVFSFLSNDDLYHAGLVCKRWSRLAKDEELWQTFQAM